MRSDRLDTMLDIKLIPPRKRAALVERANLAARFARLHEVRLLLVCAPAGYGKTSVLIQAYETLRGQGFHAAWIGLDEGDKDLSCFAVYLARAITQCGLSLGQSAGAWFGADIAPAAEALRTTILNELALLRDDVFVVLDDYHLVSDPEIKALVNTVLLSPAAQLRLLIASRTHNDLPLARLRALGVVEEIEVADLTFSEAEVSEFVARVRGSPLSSSQVARLRNATEGWAASLQMAGIALRDVSDVDLFLARFSGERRDIDDFLGDEVLRHQPEELQEFMTLTSILRRFNWSLCNAVTGGADGRAMLEAAERRNLFLFSIDPERKWFRYHHLFADFLRRRHADRYPERLATGHLRASMWLADRIDARRIRPLGCGIADHIIRARTRNARITPLPPAHDVVHPVRRFE